MNDPEDYFYVSQEDVDVNDDLIADLKHDINAVNDTNDDDDLKSQFDKSIVEYGHAVAELESRETVFSEADDIDDVDVASDEGILYQIVTERTNQLVKLWFEISHKIYNKRNDVDITGPEFKLIHNKLVIGEHIRSNLEVRNWQTNKENCNG